MNKNKYTKKIPTLAIAVIFYFLVSRLPYLNTFLSTEIAAFFLLVVLLVIFRPSEKHTIIFAIIITFVAILASLLSFQDGLEIYGNSIFMLIFYLLSRYLYTFGKEKGKKIQ